MSKELLPFGGVDGEGRPAISHLLDCVLMAGVKDVIVVLRHEKQDIPAYLAGDEWQQTRFCYRKTPGTSGVPETVALGLVDAGGQHVLFGFPDILFKPRNAFSKMMDRLEATNADVVLGLFPTNTPRKMDMVRTDRNGEVVDIEIKPEDTSLHLTWILAAWQPTFSKYLLTHTTGEHLGHSFLSAIADGFKINAVSFEHGDSLDIGTPDDLELATGWSA